MDFPGQVASEFLPVGLAVDEAGFRLRCEDAVGMLSQECAADKQTAA
jgi:hypothetical protein